MSLCYRTEGHKPTVRDSGTPSTGKRIPSILQSALPVKKKSPSISSASTHSSVLRSIDLNKEKNWPRTFCKVSPSQQQERAIPQIAKDNKSSAIDHKRRELLVLRKQLIQQQNTYIDMYAKLRELEVRSGVPTGSVGEVRLLSVTDWPVHDLLLLMPQNTPTQQPAEINGVLGPNILQQLNTQLSEIPEEVLALATELMARRLEVLDFIRTIRNETKIIVNEFNSSEWKTKNAKFDEETEKLRRNVFATVKNLEAKVVHSLDVAKILWIDRDDMIKKIDCLQRELSICKISKPLDSVIKEEEYQTVVEELKKERAARASLKEMAAAAEGKAAAARARGAELERQLHEAHAELTAARARFDNLKQQHNLRASNYDAQSKKLEKVSKSGEVTIEVLSRQREALQQRVRELQEEATVKLRETEMRETQLTTRIEALRSKLDEKEQRESVSDSRVLEVKKCLKDLQQQYNALQERARELIALQQQKCLEFLPRKGAVQCTAEELEVWNDLQATKEALGRVKEELERSRADKESLLCSLANIAHEGPENKMAEELLSKEQQITGLRNNIEELTENKRIMEQNMARCRKQVSALQMEVSLLQNLNSYESYKFEVPHEHLEAEVFNLCLQVKSLTRERDTLETEAAARALLLERHERCADLFAQVTRARRELAAQLDGNTTPSVFEGAANHEVSNALSKAYITSAETWSALRTERARVRRLEETVLAQELQLDRESLVRSQHERRRANLQRELIRSWAGGAGGSKKNIKDSEIANLLY